MKRHKSKKPVALSQPDEKKSRDTSAGVRSQNSTAAVKNPTGSQKVLQILLALALIAVIVVIYSPVRNYGFLDVDDPQYVSENPHVAGGLTWQGVWWAFTSIYASYWIPVVWLSHMLDVQLYGLNAGWHHVTNVVVHIANTILLFGLLHHMTRALGRSAFVAALFAVHPLHVESVVWVTERKDVLSTFFWLLTMWAYVSYVREHRRSLYLLTVGFFVLGLMAKPMLVTLPFVLLLIDVWPLRRLTLTGWKLSPDQQSVALRLIREKIPLFGLAVTLSVVTYLASKLTGAVAAIDQIPVSLLIGNALLSYLAYIGQMFWPSGLALFYPYPRTLPAWQVAASALVLIGVSTLAIQSIRRRPYFLIGWLWYLGTLLPVIGLIQAGDQSRADRFTYIPLIGLFIIIAWAFPGFQRRNLIALAAASLIGACALAARIQVRYWQSKSSIWEHALAVGAESYIAHTSLGIERYEQGKLDEAIMHYRAALRIRPDFAEAHNDLGVALAAKGEINEAIHEFLEGLRAKPGQAASHYNVAVLLARQGNTATAVEHLETALRLDPGYVDARRELDRLSGVNANRQ
jgi:tetratricopeptide (TPR) repeat protein